MKTLTYNILIYSDPSHSWGKIKRSMLHSLGVAHDISAYSYQRNDYVYLEEDVDLPLFIKALERTGCKAIFKEKHSDKDSAIRSYEWYALESTDAAKDMLRREMKLQLQGA